jgi:hypothetical protein
VKFTGVATNGEQSIRITATNSANPGDVRTFWVKRWGMDYWLEID